jgi:hypothetical protein
MLTQMMPYVALVAVYNFIYVIRLHFLLRIPISLNQITNAGSRGAIISDQY